MRMAQKSPLGERRVFALLFVVVGGLASATAMNAPALFIGYGLVYPVMLLAAWSFRPIKAAGLMLAVMFVALPFYVLPHSIFASVAILSMVLRPSIVYVASRVNRTHGKLGSALVLSAVETSIALGIGVEVFGVDGIEEGFAIFGITFAIFCYAAFFYASGRGRIGVVGLVASGLALLEYFLGLAAYVVPYTLLLATLALLSLVLGTRRDRDRSKLVYVGLVIALLAPVVGGPHLLDNLTVSTYPFNPASWNGSGWAQTNPSCPVMANLFVNVHDPARLRIVDPCVTVTGTVGLSIVHEVDGDFTFFLKPFAANHTALALSNYIFWQGYIHPEVIPADQHSVLDQIGGGVCPGDVLKITGALVLDTDHGTYSEIHPVYSIQVLSSAGTWPTCVLE